MWAELYEWSERLTAVGANHAVGAWLFLRALGVIYGIAFLSLAIQILGLGGREGILPIREFLAEQKTQWGWARFFVAPTFYWLNSSDRFVCALCWIGVALSILVVSGVAMLPALILLLLLYLSAFSAMRLFLGYQWDVLLLETGFLAIFIAPIRLTPAGPVDVPPWPTLILLYWLLFRLMFLSGLVKLLSGDVTWRNLSALAYHYESQPLPTPCAWHAHQLSSWVHRFSTIVMFIIELGMPFLIFAPSPWRYVATWSFIGLMVLIMLTGNYCFFNLLAIALCLLLFDDSFYREFAPRLDAQALSASNWPMWLLVPLALAVFALSLVRFARVFRLETGLLSKIGQCLDCLPVVNHYGLFSVMTTIRMEIVIEGSRDGKEWRAYEFKRKPGDVARPPPWVAPHQPRLDWQMWFAALSDYRLNGWFISLLIRLLQGSRPVLALLRHNPFPESPPLYIRAMLYEYHFTERKIRRSTGNWWRREKRWLYCPVYSLRGPEPRFMPPDDF